MPHVDADPRYISFSLRTECARCGAHLPVNGVAPRVGCADCGHHQTVPSELLHDLLNEAEQEFPASKKGTRVVGDLTWRWTFSAVEGPPCRGCGVQIPDEALGEEAQGTDVPCGACAEHHPVRAISKRVRKGVKSARRMIGGEDDQSRPEAQRDPVALQCPQCGAGLTIGQDRARQTPCDFCGTQVHLSDAVWRALHPPREVEVWHVRFEGPGPAAIRALRRKKDAAQKRAQREEKQRRKEAKEQQRVTERKASLRASEERMAAKEASEQGRRRRGTVAIGIGWMLAVPACCLMALSLGPYFFPDLPTALGVSSAVVASLRTALMGAAGFSFLVAWIWGVCAVAYRQGLRVAGTLGQSLLHVIVLGVPAAGIVVGLGLGVAYAMGAMPRPMGKEWSGHRNPFGSTLHLALLAVVGGLFCSVALAQLTDLTILEMASRLGED